MEQMIQGSAMVLMGLFLGWLLLVALFIRAWAEHGRRRRAVAGIDEALYLQGLDEASRHEAAGAARAPLPRRRLHAA